MAISLGTSVGVCLGVDVGSGTALISGVGVGTGLGVGGGVGGRVGTDVGGMFTAAAERGLQFVKGSDFVLEGAESSLRIAYSGVTPEQIEEGVKLLAEAYAEVTEGVPSGFKPSANIRAIELQ